MNKGTIIEVIYDSDLRRSHLGLTKLARKHGINIDRLKEGRFVMFLNSKQNRLKLLTCNGVLVYLKSEHEITKEQIERIPTLFYGPKFDFKKAIDLGLREAA